MSVQFSLSDVMVVRGILYLFFILLVLNSPSWAQSALGVKFFGLSIHPDGDPNAFLMPRKLDKDGVLVLNLGAEITYEKFLVRDDFSVKAVQAFYSDCAAQPGGFTHVGLRGKILKKNRSSVYGGIGPTLIYRKNWGLLADYEDPGYFAGKEDGELQYKFLWYGGELEYSYRVSDKLILAASFIPGYPKLMSLALGVTILTERRTGVDKKE